MDSETASSSAGKLASLSWHSKYRSMDWRELGSVNKIWLRVFSGKSHVVMLCSNLKPQVAHWRLGEWNPQKTVIL
jgi:hypothetical protein